MSAGLTRSQRDARSAQCDNTKPIAQIHADTYLKGPPNRSYWASLFPGWIYYKQASGLPCGHSWRHSRGTVKESGFNKLARIPIWLGARSMEGS